MSPPLISNFSTLFHVIALDIYIFNPVNDPFFFYMTFLFLNETEMYSSNATVGLRFCELLIHPLKITSNTHNL